MSNRDEGGLIDYALGMASDAEAARIERALSDSPELRSRLRELRESLTGLALAEPPRPPDPALRQRVLAATEPRSRFEGFVARLSGLFDLAESEIRGHLAQIGSRPVAPWSSALIPGTHLLRFPGGPRVAEATCGLLRVKPGRVFPCHRHRGEEWTFILQGQAIEDSGLVMRPGDLIRRAAGSQHSFRVLEGEPLVFAVVLYEGVRWRVGRALLDSLLPSRRFGR